MHPVPIAQPITTAQNDPNFLNLAQPPTPPGSDLSVSGDLKVLPLETLEAGPIALSPPLIVTEDQIGEIADKVGKVIRAVA